MKFNKTTKFMVVLAVAVISMLMYMGIYSYTNARGIEDNLLRLHVIANSDSTDDQELKLKVRDRVLSYIKDKFGDIKSKEIIEERITLDLVNINNFVKASLLEFGSNYDAKSFVGKSIFPTKDYGLYKIPEGTYDALKIIIGSGRGKNWWCVLFPPLCLADSTNITSGTFGDGTSAEKMLKGKLSEEEFSLITSSNSTDIPIKFKFKVVELFQDSKIKMSALKNRLF